MILIYKFYNVQCTSNKYDSDKDFFSQNPYYFGLVETSIRPIELTSDILTERETLSLQLEKASSSSGKIFNNNKIISTVGETL